MAQGHNISHYWWERHVPGLSLMRAEFTAHDYAPHMHDSCVIAVTERGGSRVSSRGVIDSLHPGVLFVSNPAETQSSWMNGTPVWRYRSFYLGAEGLEDIARTLGVPAVPYFTCNFFTDVTLTRAFLRLHELFERGGDEFEEREGFIRSFAELFRRHGSGGRRIQPAPRDRTILRRVARIMRERYADSLRLDDLAAAVGLTPFQLIGLFKRSLGITPHAYLTQVRLAAARSLLQQRHPLAETAAACGFYDQSALNRHFKRSYGMTPRQFAQSVL